jgi:hypothetical protein
MISRLDAVREHRRVTGDAYNFDWTLVIPPDFQVPFEVSHEAVAALELGLDQPVHRRAANLRRLFSAIVAANVREVGLKAIEAHGPFEIRGAQQLQQPLDELLTSFVAQRRMKITGPYQAAYRIVS